MLIGYGLCRPKVIYGLWMNESEMHDPDQKPNPRPLFWSTIVPFVDSHIMVLINFTTPCNRKMYR